MKRNDEDVLKKKENLKYDKAKEEEEENGEEANYKGRSDGNDGGN